MLGKADRLTRLQCPAAAATAGAVGAVSAALLPVGVRIASLGHHRRDREPVRVRQVLTGPRGENDVQILRQGVPLINV